MWVDYIFTNYLILKESTAEHPFDLKVDKVYLAMT